MDIIGIIISAKDPNGRIQLIHEADKQIYAVRYLDSSSGVVTDERPYKYEKGEGASAWTRALGDFVARTKAERDALVSLVPYEDFALWANPADEMDMPDYRVYQAVGFDPTTMLKLAEEAAIDDNYFDIEALRGDPVYKSAVAALLSNPGDIEFNGIALIIR